MPDNQETARLRGFQVKSRPLSKTPFNRASTRRDIPASSRRRFNLLQELLSAIPNKERVADVGCYGGVMAPWLRHAGCKHIDGLDLDEESLDAAAELYEEVLMWDANVDKAPVEDEHYDVVIAAEVIEHLWNVDHFLEECGRITKLNGQLLVTTPNIASLKNRGRLLLGKMPFNAPALSLKAFGEGVDQAHVNLGTFREWSLAFEANGFHVKRFRGVSSFRCLSLIDRVLPTWSGTLIFQLAKE